MGWREDPATDRQLELIACIREFSAYSPPEFAGTTKGEASDYIDRHIGLYRQGNLWAIENGYD